MEYSDAIVTEQDACFPDLRGRVALVTGGGSGIGRSIARRLAAEGMKVALCGRRPWPLEETAAAIASADGESLAIPTDLTEPDEITRLLDRVEEAFGAVNALVHNAMLMHFPVLEEYTLEAWEQSFASGSRAAYLLARRIVPQMKEAGRGGVVFISSVLGSRPNPRGLAYCAVKGALEAMTREMAVEFAGRGIRVNAVAPGLIASRREIPPGSPPSELTPLGRAGAPAEVAAVAAFLLSKQSGYITGQVIKADGGTSVQLVPPGFRL